MCQALFLFNSLLLILLLLLLNTRTTTKLVDTFFLLLIIVIVIVTLFLIDLKRERERRKFDNKYSKYFQNTHTYTYNTNIKESLHIRRIFVVVF